MPSAPMGNTLKEPPVACKEESSQTIDSSQERHWDILDNFP